MLKNFEKLTNELTEQELQTFLPIVLGGLRSKIGKSNAVPGSQIVRGVNSFLADRGITLKLSGVRLRKLINHIRSNALIAGLCSSGKGYYVASNKQELEECIESQKQRIRSQERVVECLERQYLDLYL